MDASTPAQSPRSRGRAVPLQSVAPPPVTQQLAAPPLPAAQHFSKYAVLPYAKTEITFFFASVFGDQQGYIEVWYCAGDPKRGGKMRRHCWFEYSPEHIPDLVRLCIQLLAQYGNVYTSRVCYSQPKRRPELALPSRVLFMDDAPLNGHYTFSVRTSARSCHAWIALDELVTGYTNADLCRKLAYNTYGADASGADITQLVRVPGAYNTKYGGCYPVRLVPGSQATWTTDEVHVRYPQEPPSMSVNGQLDWNEVDRAYDQIHHLLDKNGMPLRLAPHTQTYKLLSEPVWSDSSEHRWSVTKGLMIHGYPDAEIAAIMMMYTNRGSAPSKGKKWLRDDIERCIRKMRAILQKEPTPSYRPRDKRRNRTASCVPLRRGRPASLDAAALYEWFTQNVAASGRVLETQSEVAAKLKVSVSTIQRLERQLVAAGLIKRYTISHRQSSVVELGGGVKSLDEAKDQLLEKQLESPIPMHPRPVKNDMEHTPATNTFEWVETCVAPREKIFAECGKPEGTPPPYQEVFEAPVRDELSEALHIALQARLNRRELSLFDGLTVRLTSACLLVEAVNVKQLNRINHEFRVVLERAIDDLECNLPIRVVVRGSVPTVAPIPKPVQLEPPTAAIEILAPVEETSEPEPVAQPEVSSVSSGTSHRAARRRGTRQSKSRHAQLKSRRRLQRRSAASRFSHTSQTSQKGLRAAKYVPKQFCIPWYHIVSQEGAQHVWRQKWAIVLLRMLNYHHRRHTVMPCGVREGRVPLRMCHWEQPP